MHERLRAFLPQQAALRRAETARIVLGALIGIAVTAVVTRLWLGPLASVPLLIAPMGASAVLLFAVPASPLAQPWPMFVGNVVSALIGVACARMIAIPEVAAAVAVAAALLAMGCLRCLHPPGGAVALTAALGGPAVEIAGYGFAFAPVALNSALLLATALLFNNLARHPYPHVARHDAPEVDGWAVQRADIDRALAGYGERLDVDPEDLLQLFHDAEAEARMRMRAAADQRRTMRRDKRRMSA